MSISANEQGPTNQCLSANTNSDEGTCNSEVKSDTEEYFEYFEIDGQQYRRKMTKRTVVEKHKCQQTVFAPLKSDGSGPDLTNVAIFDEETLQEGNTIETADELQTHQAPVLDSNLQPFKRFTEDRFRISGSKFLPRYDKIKKMTLPCYFDSSIDKAPALLANYMYRCGQSDFEIPIVDTQLSTVLHEAIDSEWFNTKEIDLPHEKSKSISYFKKTSYKNENGNMVYNIFEKTKSRKIRMKLENNSTQSSLEFHPDDDQKLTITYAAKENQMLDNYDKEVDDQKEQFNGTNSSILISFDDGQQSSNINDGISNYNSTTTPTESQSSPTRTSVNKYSFILKENNSRSYLLFDDDAKHEECDIAGGPVDALIVHACDGKEHLLFLGAFLDTYRTFIEPEDLINRLIIRYKFYRSKAALDLENEEYNDKDSRHSKAGTPEDDYEKKCIHVLSLLVTVIGKLKRDITDGIETQLQLFEEYLHGIGENRWIDTIKNTIKTIQESTKKDDEMVQLLEELSSTSESQNNLKSSLKSRSEFMAVKLTIFDFSSRKIAEQMTLLDWAKYRDVELIEVLNLKDIAKCKLPGVIEYAKHFQNVQYWAQTMLLDPDKRTSDRDRNWQKFYSIMKHLRELNNYSSYIAILLAIQLLPIKKLFSKKIRAKITEMEEYMKPTKFLGYKEDLKQATAPCIPFLGLFYQDLVMLNIANPQYLDLDEIARVSSDSNWTSNNNYHLLSTITYQCGPVINFWRSFKQYLFLKNCNKDQDKIRYSIKPNEKILRFLNNFQSRYDEITIQKMTKQLLQSA